MKPRKLPSGTWFVQTQINGHRKSFSAPTRAEVIRKATSYKLTALDAPSAPLGAILDNYIASKRNILSPTTIKRYELTRRNEFQRLMNVPVRELTSERMQIELNIMAASKSPKTVRNDYGLIRAALAMYAPEIHLRVTLPAKKQLTYHTPTTEEVYSLLNAASLNMQTAIMLAAFCGLRRGEIVALTYDDVHDNVIHVHSAAVIDQNKSVVVKSPKTYTSDRYIPIPDFVLSHILGNKHGKKVCPLSLNSITHRFSELRDRLGYKCRFHDLRHYYASACHAIGIPDQYIMRFGGWKSDAILKSVYRGTLTDFEQDSADKISAYFDESANKMLTRP